MGCQPGTDFYSALLDEQMNVFSHKDDNVRTIDIVKVSIIIVIVSLSLARNICLKRWLLLICILLYV